MIAYSLNTYEGLSYVCLHETSAYSLLCTMHLIKPFPSFTYLRCFSNEMILTFLHYGFLRRYENNR